MDWIVGKVMMIEPQILRFEVQSFYKVLGMIDPSIQALSMGC